MTKIIFLILIATVFMSLGNVCFKKGVHALEPPHWRKPGAYALFLGHVFRTPLIWLGFASIATAIVVWLVALAQAELSVAYPIDSLQYIVTLIAARIFLEEKIDRMKLFGTALVVGGIVLISLS